MRHTILAIVAIVSVTLGQSLPDPVLVSPESNQDSVPISTSFVWNSVEGADTYFLQVSSTANFYAPHINVAVQNSDTSYTHSLPLWPTTKYYWRISAAGSGLWSSNVLDSFTTAIAPPANVAQISPAPSAFLAMDVQPDLVWRTTLNADGYEVEVATDTGYTNTVMSETLTDTSITTTGLENITVYYWRVRAHNAGGNGPWTTRRQFQLSVPSKAVTEYPTDGADSVALDDTLRWTEITGAQYQVEISKTTDFTIPLVLKLGLTDNEFDLGTIFGVELSHGTTYHWRVKGYTTHGHGEYSDTASFTTAEEPHTTHAAMRQALKTKKAETVWVFDMRGRKVMKTERISMGLPRSCYILTAPNRITKNLIMR